MASSNVYRNGGAQRGSGKFDRVIPAGPSLKTTSFKSRVSQSPGSALRRSSPASLAARNGEGG